MTWRTWLLNPKRNHNNKQHYTEIVLKNAHWIWNRWMIERKNNTDEQVNSYVNEDMHDMCIGSQEALFMQVDGGRKKILRIFYALQLFIQLQRWQKKKKYRRLNMKFDAAKGYFKLTIIRGRKYFAFQGQIIVTMFYHWCHAKKGKTVILSCNSSMHITKKYEQVLCSGSDSQTDFITEFR